MNSDKPINWADYCVYWHNQFCLLKIDKCPWSYLGGYPIIENCQFFKDAVKT